MLGSYQLQIHCQDGCASSVTSTPLSTATTQYCTHLWQPPSTQYCTHRWKPPRSSQLSQFESSRKPCGTGLKAGAQDATWWLAAPVHAPSGPTTALMTPSSLGTLPSTALPGAHYSACQESEFCCCSVAALWLTFCWGGLQIRHLIMP